jgi:hypothetical protein
MSETELIQNCDDTPIEAVEHFTENVLASHSSSRLVDLNAISKNISKLMGVLNPIVTNIGNIKEAINPEIIYIAKFPKAILSKMSTGEFDFMKSGGEIISTIVDKTKPRNPVVKHLRLDKIANNSQSILNIGQMLQNIAVQQQLANITERLDEIANKAEKILVGQMTDRMGFIYGAWDTYQQALSVANEELSNSLKLNIIQSLNIGRQQLLQYIDSQNEFFSKLPKTEFKTFFRNINGNLIKECESTFNSCNQAIVGVALSTIVLSNIYLSYGEVDVLTVLSRPLTEMVDKNRGNFKHLSAITAQISESMQWVIEPNSTEEFLDYIKNPIKNDANEYIEIEILGNELLKLSEEN